MKQIRGILLLIAAMTLTEAAFASATDNLHTQTRPGDSLWTLFDRQPAESSIGRFAWMITLQKLNPQAFIHPCNGNSLITGASLSMPQPGQAEGISEEAARQEFSRQSKEWEGYRKHGTTSGCSEWFRALELPSPKPSRTAEPDPDTTADTTAPTLPGGTQEGSDALPSVANATLEPTIPPGSTQPATPDYPARATLSTEESTPDQAQEERASGAHRQPPPPEQTEKAPPQPPAPLVEIAPPMEKGTPSPTTAPASDPSRPAERSIESTVKSLSENPLTPQTPSSPSPTQIALDEGLLIETPRRQAVQEGTPPTQEAVDPNRPLQQEAESPSSGTPSVAPPVKSAEWEATTEPTADKAPPVSTRESKRTGGENRNTSSSSLVSYALYAAALIVVALILFLIWRKMTDPGKGVKAIQGKYRQRILLAVSLVVVLGQGLYAYLNVSTFQQSYLQSVQFQSQRLAAFLQQDIEFVLKLGIPLQKLIKIEASLAEVLDATPEIEFIEITDLKHHVIYYADHQEMGQITDSNRLSATLGDDPLSGGPFSLSRADTDIRLPVTNGRSGEHVGYIQMRISSSLIQDTSREIIWDITTVILISLLITFEFLNFFVNRGFREPLQQLTQKVARAARLGGVIRNDSGFAMPGIDRVIAQTNRWMGRARLAGSLSNAPASLPEEALNLAAQETDRQLQRVGEIGRQTAGSELPEGAEESLRRIQSHITALKQLTERQPDPVPNAVESSSAGQQEPEAERLIPYHYIRPFVFLFFIAYNLPVSFFPMYVETLYEPLMGLPVQVLIGLPISLFMLFFALSMLLAGVWLDRQGWFQPLLAGGSTFMVGFVLTAYASSYAELLIYRSMTAVGLGILFMGFQQFIIENTDTKNRGIGFSSFLGAFFAGEIVGTAIGGILASRLGYSNIFLLSGVVSALALIGIALFFRHSLTKASAPSITTRVSMGQILGAMRDREFLALVVFQAIPAKIALVGFLMYFVPLYLFELGTMQSNIARIAMCYALMLIIFGPVVSRLFGKPRLRKYTILLGGLITGISMTAFAFSSDTYVTLLLVAALGIAHAFSLSSQASLVAETQLVRRLGPGTGMGVYRFWERVGNVAGPFVMAGLITWLGYQQGVVVLGISIVVSSLIYIVLVQSIPSDAGGVEEKGANSNQSYANI